MLTLREKLSPCFFESPASLFFSGSNTSEKDRNEIIKWCQKNGYPFDITDKIKINSPKAKSLFPKLKPDTHISFAIADFICRLHEVYCSFQIYKLLAELTDKIQPTLYAKGFDKNKKGTDGFVHLNEISKTVKNYLNTNIKILYFKTQYHFTMEFILR